MHSGSILLVGGSGVVGRQAARWIRQRQPDAALLIGGRNMDTAGAIAEQVGNARPLKIDMDKPRLGLADDVKVSAVVMLAPDDGLNGLAYAQDQGVPFLSIVNGLVEVGPEIALFAHNATAAPVILASHWMGGAATFLALKLAQRFEVTRSITLGAIIDENDQAGPTALEDMERVHESAPPALIFKDGRRTWLTGDAVKAPLRAIDGRSLEASAFSTFDTASLYVATGARNIRFDLASGSSSSREAGGEPAAEIVVEVEGDVDGRAQRVRGTLEFKEGLASLTGLCVALAVGAALGLEGRSALKAGMSLPELLWRPDDYLEQLAHSGVTIEEQRL